MKKPVEAALQLLEKIAEAEKIRAEVNNLKMPSEVIEYGRRNGFDFSKKDLDAAMKLFVERQLGRAGVPEWIKLRLGMPVHD
jgi:hypothetical protein